MKFNFRVEDLEVRIVGEHNQAEIVRWLKDVDKHNYCWTIAYWKEREEGYDLQFVGGRAFDVDAELFMKLAKQGHQVLNDVFNCR